MKLYTKTGDKGKTQVIGNRVYKDDLQVEAYGTVDELNSFIGVASIMIVDERIRKELEIIQHALFDLGSDLASLQANKNHYLSGQEVTELESWIDFYSDNTTPLSSFILPGGSPSGAQLHVCRTVARRAERKVVSLSRQTNLEPVMIMYLNRLSDYFFSVARYVNEQGSHKETEYHPKNV